MTRTTMRDVAERAGVSVQTVSNVLNGHPSIRPHTRERVLTSIRDLDYHPNQAARALRQSRVTTLCSAFYGHASVDVADPYRNLIQSAFIAEATERGYSLSTNFLRDDAGEDEGSFARLRQGFLRGEFGGAIFAGTVLEARHLRPLADWKLPHVIFDSDARGLDETLVTADYAGGMAQLVRHHAQRGRRHLALVLPTTDSGYSAVERQRGFREAALETGVRVTEHSGDWTFESGERAMHALWNSADRPDAVLAGNDRMAAGALRAALALGLQVPGDLAISGFDDFEFAHYTTPGLTTVRVPYEAMAREAVALLCARVEAPDLPPAPRVIQPVSLVLRESA